MHDPGKIVVDPAVPVALGGDCPADAGVQVDLGWHSVLGVSFYLWDFQAKIRALSGRRIPVSRASELIAAARRILAVVGRNGRRPPFR